MRAGHGPPPITWASTHKVMGLDLARDVHVEARLPAVGEARAAAHATRPRGRPCLLLAVLLRRDGRAVAFPADIPIRSAAGTTPRSSSRPLHTIRKRLPRLGCQATHSVEGLLISCSLAKKAPRRGRRRLPSVYEIHPSGLPPHPKKAPRPEPCSTSNSISTELAPHRFREDILSIASTF